MESSLGPSCSADLVVRHSLAQIRTSGLGNLWVGQRTGLQEEGERRFRRGARSVPRCFALLSTIKIYMWYLTVR